MVDDMCCSPAKITVFRHFVAFAITQLQDRRARCVGSSAKLGGVCLDDRGPVRVNSLSGKDSHAEYLEDCFHFNDAPKREIATVLEYIRLESEFEEWKNEVIKYFGSFIYKEVEE